MGGLGFGFVEREEEVLEYWEKEDIFRKSIDQRVGREAYVFYEGPPGTNGLPHVGHLLQSTLKDLWPRYKTMKGYRVMRKAGWDTHGLPVEWTAEKELGLKSRGDIEEYGVWNFLEYCRGVVSRYKQEWTEVTKRLGRFLDFRDEYATLTNEYIQSEWWVLKEAWKKGLLYKSYKILPYCPRLGTVLSNQEVALGYREVEDMSLTVKFSIRGEEKRSFLAWTTTSWTLLGNIALTLGENIRYVEVEHGGERYILGEDRVKDYEERGVLKGYRLIKTWNGKDFEGVEYEPLWDYFKGSVGKKYCVVNDEYVSTEEGTGIVHIAFYGEDDYRLIQKNGLEVIQHVDLSGNFIEGCGKYSGRYFDEEGLDIEILKDLSVRGKLLEKRKIRHSYPYNDRTGTRLIYYGKTSWFLKTTALKDIMARENKGVEWHPGNVKEGRFGKWLEGNVDWAISRDRYWGVPLPIWRCVECGEEICIGSIQELNLYAELEFGDREDLHGPNIDGRRYRCRGCQGEMEREKEVLDCWFDAGVMPWGQMGYPRGEGSTREYEDQYPSDFICEGVDQTRGWFYVLLVISTMLTGKSSYKRVLCTGLVLDGKGQKMSKSKGNVVDAKFLLKKYGADAIRWVFVSHSIGNSVRFGEEFVEDAIKEVLLPVWNIYSFFTSYAKIDGYKPGDFLKEEELVNDLDRWIVSERKRLILGVGEALEEYNCGKASQRIKEFIDHLSNWYIRRSRRRFWKAENDEDKKRAYETLYDVFMDFLKVLAPFLPLITEYLYQKLKGKNEKESIHLCEYPEVKGEGRDLGIEYEMRLVRDLVSLCHSLRNQHQLKVRQPLKEMVIICQNEDDRVKVRKHEGLILEELNIKRMRFAKDDGDFVDYEIKGNKKNIWGKYKKRAKEMEGLIASLDRGDLEEMRKNGKVHKNGLAIDFEDIMIRRRSKGEVVIEVSKDFTVVLDTKLTDELMREGLMREFINKVQKMRKEKELKLLDRIGVKYAGSVVVKESVDHFSGYINQEVLCEGGVEYCEFLEGGKEWELNGEKVRVQIQKV